MSRINDARFHQRFPHDIVSSQAPPTWAQGQPPWPFHKPWRSKSAAVLFGIFLGDFGVHNFYLSQFVRGALHLFLLVGGVGVFTIGLKVSAAWPATAGIPRGLELYILGIAMIGINSLWRWVDVIIIASTPKELFAHK